jgi:hypothetical protein
MLRKLMLTALLMQVIVISVFSQKQNEAVLQKASLAYSKEFQENFALAIKMAKEKGWQTSFVTRNGDIAFLVGVNPDGSPVYYATESNVTAAATIGANQLWSGGTSGLNLSGGSNNVKDKLGIWDGGKVLASHQELIGSVTQMDGASTNSDHATHVTGTMMATGISANAKGMAYNLQGIKAYDFSSDVSEMFGAASSLLVSNHSYGAVTGWSYNSGQSRWEFYGQFGDNEDRNFGYYDNSSMLWDSIAYNAPYYLMVKSAGNNRNENGPAVGAVYWRRDASGTWVSAVRPAGISSNDTYNTISTNGNAKNILTVGAVSGLPNGYQNASGVLVSSFSSWGPTDDGRIKPDVVAMGVNLFSSIASSNTSYATYSGTSMSSPNASGGLLLLQEYYSQLNGGAFLRSASLKGLAIHTAEEAGFSPGPDYLYGWGLLNVNKASDVIKSKNLGSHKIFENVLNNGGSFSTNVMATGPLTVTLVWTDPKGTPVSQNILNNPELKLVHDLDVRVTRNANTYMPWVLNPGSPDAPATTGDNFRDNVEKINVPSNAGEFYTITVTHKGTLARGSQAYSLIVSGIGGPVYCVSGATSNAGTRIDSVSIANINKQNAAGCTTYTNNSASIVQLQPNQVTPLFVALNSCDASSASKIVKAFIDWNSDGDFDDAGELVGTSGVLNGNANFTTNITVPGNVSVGAFTNLRIVAVETTNAASVLPCGTYATGETQDYLVNIVAASNDMTIGELVAPKNNACENASQYVTVKLNNNGSASKTNIPVTAVIKNGATTVATLTATYSGTIAPGTSANYTFQTPFNSQAGNSYSFLVYVSDPAEQVVANDTLTKTVNIGANPASPSGVGVVCSGNAILAVANPEFNANYFWYADAASSNPFATGTEITTTTIPANNTYYVTRGAKGTIGVASKNAFANGGSYVSTTDLTTSNYMKYSSTVPVILESARIYSKQGGKVNIVVAGITGSTVNFGSAVTTTVDLLTTSTSPGGGNQANDPNDNGAIYQLNIPLPAGDNVIIIQTVGNANVFRNDNVTGNPYPFSIPGLISFTGNNASNFQNFYFYLYDMKVKTVDCISPKATVLAPTAPTPIVTQVGDSLVSSIDNGNQWYLNNNFIPGATAKKYKPTTSGTYSVKVNDAFGCQMTSTSINVVLSAVVNLPSSEIRLSVAPNPSRGSFVLKFNVDKKEDLSVDLINIQGQKVSSRTYPKYQGSFSQQMSFKNLASGVYVLRIQHGTKVYHEKVVVE